jgi:hypothetical protein
MDSVSEVKAVESADSLRKLISWRESKNKQLFDAISKRSRIGQAEFEKMRLDYYKLYIEQKNEVKKSEIFRKAAESTKSSAVLLSWHIENWKGVIVSITTSHGGEKAFISIQSRRYGIAINYESYLKIDTNIYNKVGQFSIGEAVYFSGNFKTDNQNQLIEKSFTELGSIDNPTFDIELSDIKIQ